MREALHPFAEVAAREFNDQAPFRATLSRIVNLYHRAGLPLEDFTGRFDAARQRTKERTAAIHTLAGETAARSMTRKNKMPYFFALLEELLGLRESPSPPEPDTEEADWPPATAPAVAARASPWPRSPRQLADGDGGLVQSPVPDRPGALPGPSIETEEDARLIKGVVRTFSRQFTDYAAADALGDWAVSLWRRSGLPGRRFLEVAQEASAAMLKDRATTPSAPAFQVLLTEMLAQLETIEGTDRSGDAQSSSNAGAAGLDPENGGHGGDHGRH